MNTLQIYQIIKCLVHRTKSKDKYVISNDATRLYSEHPCLDLILLIIFNQLAGWKKLFCDAFLYSWRVFGSPWFGESQCLTVEYLIYSKTIYKLQLNAKKYL